MPYLFVARTEPVWTPQILTRACVRQATILSLVAPVVASCAYTPLCAVLLVSMLRDNYFRFSYNKIIFDSMEKIGIYKPKKPKNYIFFFTKKKFKIRILTSDDGLKSPGLRQYQSYISNWCIHGKVFTCTTTLKPKFFFFFKSSNSNFDSWRRAEITLVSSISVLH